MSEEDIKILEELKEFLLSTNHEPQYNISQYTNAIENLIKRNKKLEKQMGKDLDVVYLQGVYNERDKWKNKIKAKIEELGKKEKEELKGTKGQDRYNIKQEFMFKKNILQKLLEE